MKLRSVLPLLSLILGQSLFAQSSAISATPEDLKGRWFKSCDGGSVRVEDFGLTKVTLNEIYFLDRECRLPSLVLISEGGYTLPADGQMDFQFSAVKIRLMSADAIRDFNTRKVCGFSNWKFSLEKEISGRPCEIFFVGLPQRIPAVGEMRYGIYRVDGTRLSLGKLTRDFNGTTPEKRPTEFQPRVFQRLTRKCPASVSSASWTSNTRWLLRSPDLKPDSTCR